MPTTKKKGIIPKKGQIWKDLHNERSDRRFVINKTDATYAYVNDGNKNTKINLARFSTNKYAYEFVETKPTKTSIR